MHNSEFSELLKQSFEKESKSSFLKKLNIVDTTEEHLNKEPNSMLVAADVIGDGAFDTVGTFEFVARTYPNIKTGVKIPNTSYETMTLTADNLAKGCTHRLNDLIALHAFGGGSVGGFVFETEALEGVHTSVDKYDINSINEKLKYMETTYGMKYDRITLNGVLLTLLTGEVKSVPAKRILKEKTGLKIDIDNGYYNQRGIDGKMTQRNYVPMDKLILSNSKNDKSDSFYFANLPVASEHQDVNGEYGITGYVDGDIAWSVMRGVPILRDKTAFSTITFK